jgi:heat shock protein 5
MKNTVEDKEKGLGNKLSESEKDTIMSAIKEHQEWLSANIEADKEDFETHLKDLQKVCDPIIGRIYKEAGAQPGADDDYANEEPEDTGL